MVCSKFSRVVSAIAALQLVAVGEGERVHDEIERAPFLADHLEHALDALQILDVGLLDDLERRSTWASGTARRPKAPP